MCVFWSDINNNKWMDVFGVSSLYSLFITSPSADAASVELHQARSPDKT